ncbi:MAG: YbbR-like domain-containing protein [Desulfobacula sp.]|nr:YbbR-like domain-containing protein [Desulfobacula sp.]
MHKSRFSLIFMFLIFMGCTTEPVETDLLLPVYFANVPDNMILTDFHTDKIEIKIQAAPKLMELINKENIRYTVDLYTNLEFDPAGASDSIEPGAYLIPVELKRIPMNPGIKILSVEPSYLSVQLEKKIDKTFKISIPYEGLPAKGYIALEAIINPNHVTLSGAAPFINSITNLKTKPIDLANVKKTFQKNIPLDLNNPSLISSPDHIISVKIPIVQQLVSKTIENIPIQIYNYPAPAHSANIEPAKITIKIKGLFEELNNKKIMDQIYAFIDMKDLKPGVYARHAYINIPVELIMTDAIPQVFTIKIE